MAIALDGGLHDVGPDGRAGQLARGRLGGRTARFPIRPSDLKNVFTGRSAAAAGVSAKAAAAEAENEQLDGRAAEISQPATINNPQLVKESFIYLMAEGPAAMEYFYARLFAASPETRSLFPMTMTAQRERMFAAFARVVWSLDNQPGCVELVSELGRDHRRFGVTDRHVGVFFAALRDTAKHFIGPQAWTVDTAAAWDGALKFIAQTMRSAAEEDAELTPPWWTADIVGHELRSPGVAVLRLRPDQPLPYTSGQYVQVQVTRWPRVWRPYSIANSPRPGGLIELHVRAIPGGQVSNTLVHHSEVGDCVLLGPPTGSMTLTDSDRDLLCIAGGTGLAPIKAIIEEALSVPDPVRHRRITLFFGVRQHFDLYDLEDLQLLEAACPGLRVFPVLSDEPGYSGLTGNLPDVAVGHGLFENTDAYICGPPAMVSQTAALLAASIPASQIHHDPLP